MTTPLSMTSMFTNMITNPVAVFDSIKLKTSFMAPLLVTIAMTMVIFYMYFQQVDPTWLVDHMISLSTEDLAPDQIEAMRKFMKPENMMIFAMIGAAIGTVVISLLQALYLMLVGNTKNMDVSYGEWFSLASWSFVPAMILSVMMLVNMIIGDNSQLAIELINPINFASLFDIEAPGKTYNLLASLSVVNFLGLYLVAAGFKHWSQSSWLASVTIVAMPYVLYWLAQIFVF